MAERLVQRNGYIDRAWERPSARREIACHLQMAHGQASMPAVIFSAGDESVTVATAPRRTMLPSIGRRAPMRLG